MVSCFSLLVAVSSTFADFKPFLMCTRYVALQLQKCLKQLQEAKKQETIVEGERLRIADILSTAQDSTAHDSTPQRNPPSLLLLYHYSFYSPRIANDKVMARLIK